LQSLISKPVQDIHLIAFTHRTIAVQDIGQFHLADDVRASRLCELKTTIGASELMYLSTCNRVEFLLVQENEIDTPFLHRFFRALLPQATDLAIDAAINQCAVFRGEEALMHIFSVAASLDSLVVGEREIITQVRNAYENSTAMLLTGDTLRLLVRKTIETAKAVYTQTAISRNPVSVVSLAWRKLRALNVQHDARFLIIGAGVTNTAMVRYLKKHGFHQFAVFNRTLNHAETLAAEIGGKAYPLTALNQYRKGFDVLVTCTGAAEAIITPDLYRSLIQDDTRKKIVIDLAVPNDLDPAILNAWDVNVIAVNNLQEVAKDNLKEREKELTAAQEIVAKAVSEFRTDLKARQVELAMRAVPDKVKEIREAAMNAVFANEIEQLDDASKELLNRVLNYVEKKYISVPMKMAREILLDEARQN
jgi:glutamyl-tRNA reductase